MSADLTEFPAWILLSSPLPFALLRCLRPLCSIRFEFRLKQLSFDVSPLDLCIAVAALLSELRILTCISQIVLLCVNVSLSCAAVRLCRNRYRDRDRGSSFLLNGGSDFECMRCGVARTQGGLGTGSRDEWHSSPRVTAYA